jgi:hypothetical protein
VRLTLIVPATPPCEGLAGRLASHLGVALLQWDGDAAGTARRAREQAPGGGSGGFVLLDATASRAEAADLEAALADAGLPLELVLEVRAPGCPLPERILAPGVAPETPQAHYRSRGLLRRLEAVAGPDYLLAAACRILDDLRRSRAMAPAAPPRAAAAPPPERPPPQGVEASTAPPAPDEGSPAEGGWRRSPARHGRLRRGPGGAKGPGRGGWKPRR